ncbi:hypothetical protein K435DRAFT_859958 [Dendrothele bispora CBS 962.96]|uniref:F-box domain-containing protein n=1 Tax=Dendrothele bispora (strain CBS 962.96) TaxID=1314807 RepID=A0A4S8LZ44_DENBC|nr:hypothetical protein K435DRAFT_859958 [Dendrothele bispora CBS 962.96]
MHPQTTNLGSASVHCKRSSVLDTLRANFGTYTSDITHASQCLIDAERDAQRCDDEIQKLQAEIISLRNRQQSIYRRIDRYRSLLAPIRKLPPEVLGRIFRLICTKNFASASEIDCPAVHLSHVCVGWRDLARTTPSLWSRISIDLFYPQQDLFRVKSMLITCLALSNPSPIFLHLTMSEVDVDAKFVLQSIMHHCARWAEVCLNMTTSHFSQLSPIKGKLPLLQSLKIRTGNIFDEVEVLDIPESLDCFSLAPRLRAVAIGYIDDTTDISTLPWGQISDLKLHFFTSLNSALDVLRLATQARSVTLSLCTLLDPSNIAQNFTHSLNSLSIILDIDDVSDPFRCFQMWTMPQLNCLHLSIRELHRVSRDTCNFDELHSFVQRSGCVITTLSLINLGLDGVEIIALLQCLTSLADLTLHEHRDDVRNLSLTSSFLQKMTVNHRASSSTHFLPHLKKIDFRIHFPSSILLVSMVQSRWIPDDIDAAEIGVDCLDVVKIHVFISGDPPIDQILRPLLAMKPRGLQCTVSFDKLG